MIPALAPTEAQAERSDEIHAAILAALEGGRAISASELAQAAGITRRHLAKLHWHTNLRLAGAKHPCRIQKTYHKRRCYWSLQPITR